MRRRLWVLISTLVLAIALGFLGRASGAEAWHVLAGLAWVIALAVAISLLPWWGRVIPPVRPMPGLFAAPEDGERWCSICGTPAPAGAACTVCGTAPRVKKEREA